MQSVQDIEEIGLQKQLEAQLYLLRVFIKFFHFDRVLFA